MAKRDQDGRHGPRERNRWDAWTAARPKRPAGAASGERRLQEIEQFGPNPGALRMLAYAPRDLPAGAPLVVVLHGCTQDAHGYDSHAGWTRLAEREGFAVLYPEQQRANNAQRCFNWFLAADAARGLGETRSIREMIAVMVDRHGIDESRIFVTGLSAGGAMASALLADYPEVFAAGAVIAGLPCGAARSIPEAFEAMSRPGDRSAAELGDLVRAGSPHAGPWPRISIWHGAADTTVVPKNAENLVKQWVEVHGAPHGEFHEEVSDGHLRRVWRAGGLDVVELHVIAGMGHGTPLDARLGERKGPYMLDVGVSSTRLIAKFWGLSGALAEDEASARQAVARRPEPAASGAGESRQEPRPDNARRFRGADIGGTIERALRAAGLMR